MGSIAVMGTGDMGSAVGKALKQAGHRVMTSLSGRSEHSRRLAREAGLEDAGSLEALINQATHFLSIMPPAAAESFAENVFSLAARKNPDLLYVDCNAVSPETVQRIGAMANDHRIRFQDLGIIGLAPVPNRIPCPVLYQRSLVLGNAGSGNTADRNQTHRR